MKSIKSIIYIILLAFLVLGTACEETFVVLPGEVLSEEYLYFNICEETISVPLGNNAIVTLPAEGSKKELIVNTNCDWNCVLPSDIDWIEKEEGQDKLIFTSQANEGLHPRECMMEINIRGGLFQRVLRIVQGGSAPYFTTFASGTELGFGAESGTDTYPFSTNIATSEIDIDNNNDWITVALEKGKLSVSVQANNSADSRTSTPISLKYSTETLLSFTVRQEEIPATGEGTEANPYNVVQALKLTRTLSSSERISGVYVKGLITSIVEVSTSYGNATYHIADKIDGVEFYVYRGYWLNGVNFTSENQIKVGDEVVVYGDLINYAGSTPEFTTGNYLISLNGENDGSTADPATGVNTIKLLSQELTEMPEGWTFENVKLPDEITNVWSWRINDGQGCLQGYSGFGTTSYAISPVIDFTNVTEASLSFEHSGQFEYMDYGCGLRYRILGNSKWEGLFVRSWTFESGWTYIDSGDVNLEACLGNKIQLAFEYGSQYDNYWRIRNLVIKMKLNGLGLGGYGEDQDLTIKTNK